MMMRRSWGGATARTSVVADKVYCVTRILTFNIYLLDVRLLPAERAEHGRAAAARSFRAVGPRRRRELPHAGLVDSMAARERRRRVEVLQADRALVRWRRARAFGGRRLRSARAFDGPWLRHLRLLPAAATRLDRRALLLFEFARALVIGKQLFHMKAQIVMDTS